MRSSAGRRCSGLSPRHSRSEPAGVCCVAKSAPKGQTQIDRMMERASTALEAMRYFEAERLASTALRRAHAAADFERMARILLPLQEARRQKRQLAVDSG